MKRKMKKTLEQEMEKHLSLYGVVYFVIEPTGELGLIDGTGCTVSDYEVIPETVYIGMDAFSKCTGIRSVDMSGSRVKWIHTCAFFGCENLESVYFPECLVKVGCSAFEGCPLKELKLPGSLDMIEPGAFSFNNELEEITIPQGVTMIGDMAFEGCPKLSHAYLLPSIDHIGSNVFDRCGALKAIFVEQGEEEKIKRELSPGMQGKVMAV